MSTLIIDLLLSLSLAITGVFGGVFAIFSAEAGHVTVVPAPAAAITTPVATDTPSTPHLPQLPAQPAAPAEYGVIERGNSGEAVLQLQMRLTELGYYTGNLSGKMDSATQLAYKKFERANGFTANGIASAEEQAVLFSEDAVAAQ